MVNLIEKSKYYCAIGVAAAIFGTPALAQDTMLTLTNTITGMVVEMSEEAFMGLDQVIMNTENEWVDGMTAFEGPLARDVLALITDFDAASVKLVAVDDYSVSTPIEHFLEFDVIFAHSMDGNRLSSRSKGPIWVLYPLSDNKELQDPVYNQYQIWQLAAVEVQ